MELEIKFKTPGTHLSMQSMQGVIRSIIREIELGVYDALIEEYPHVSSSLLKKKVRNKVDLSLSDARKGSWEIVLLGSLGTLIAGVSINLVSDLIVNSETWKETRNKVYSISDKAAVNVKKRLERKHKLGPFNADKKSVGVSKKPNGVSKLELNVELERRNSNEIDFDMEKEVESLIEQLKNRDSKTNK